MSSITITIKIDVPEGSSVNVGHTESEITSGVGEIAASIETEAPPKKRKKAVQKSEPAAAVAEPSATTAEPEVPAPSAEPVVSSESTPEAKEAGTANSSKPDTSTEAAEGDIAELLPTVLGMLKSGRIHTDKAVAKEMIKEVSRTFGVDTVPQVPRDKWGDYMVALDAKITERSVA